MCRIARISASVEANVRIQGMKVVDCVQTQTDNSWTSDRVDFHCKITDVALTGRVHSYMAL